MQPTFSFPFEPYDIQKKFMKELYFTIENKKIGIFESPTGTGKSLSICCGALQWLKDYNKRIINDLQASMDEIKCELTSKKDGDDWLQEEYSKIKLNQSLKMVQLKFDKISQREVEFNELKKRVVKQKNNVNNNLEKYLKSNKRIQDKEVMENVENKETEEDQDLLVEDCVENERYDIEETSLTEEDDNVMKIYISSRTHSQLAQFIGEVKRTIFGDNTRVVTLASRQHYCINSDVNKLKNVNLINERCLDMQKSKTKTTSLGEEGKVLKRTKTASCTACPYYNQNNITNLQERLLVDIMDMEDLVKYGKQLKACPYYATRMALDKAEGKSLSICCGALQWLKDYNKRIINDLQASMDEIKCELTSKKDGDDWLQEEYSKIKLNQSLKMVQLKFDKISQREVEFNELKKRVVKQKNNVNNNLEKYLKSNKRIQDKEVMENVENKETEEDQDLLVEDCVENERYDIEETSLTEEDDNVMKIYISSRTHSQLAQFIGEVKRTIFGDNTRVVTLASRQHYCINSDVNKLKNVNLINERCLDMQKSKTKTTSLGEEGKVLKRTKTASCTACPYYNQNNITNLQERLLVDIMDMEDLVKYGKQLKACPYYATRMALDKAEVVLISHAGIVSSGARSGISLKLQDNVLILDEAHGLTAALENAHSAPVSVKQLSSVKTFLDFYINKYIALLSSKNLLQLNQLKFVVGKLLGMVKPKQIDSKQAKVFTLEEFVINAEIDHLHLRPLVEFCRNTRLAPKLHGFSMRYSQQALEQNNIKKETNKNASLKEFLTNITKKKGEKEIQTKEEKPIIQPNIPTETSAGSGLYAVLDFIEMLCDRSENGRVFAQMGENGQLKYLLLNPAEHFAKVVSECRSVIVAGGTMEPVSEFQALLTNNTMEEERLTVVKCDHVVSPDNVLGICLSKGPSNINLNFSYENRTSKDLLNEVGRILINVCNIVPDGIVCFLPSYSYEQTLYDHLCSSKAIEVMSKKKKIFREPKSAGEVDQVLQKYASAIKNKIGSENGALLLSVVGGKLSEGLNFSDELGRCVIVIGLPYPNIKSLELQEKINYLNNLKPGTGSTYCENLCMKAVNQCIGRAVRHVNDYACVMLVDERYSRPQTISALPSFIKKSLLPNCAFGQTIGNIAKFFTKHKKRNYL